MRSSSPHLGLIGLDQWLGGTIYIHNLIRALSHLPESERPRITLFCRCSADLFHEVLPLVDKVVIFRSLLDRVFAGTQLAIPARRANALVSAILLRETAPELARCAQRERVDAVFPVSGPYTRSLPCPIAWIPDLQHRAFPHLFSPLTCAMRNHRFSSLLRDPRKHVVFSSRSAMEDATRAFGTPRAHIHLLRFVTVPAPGWSCDPAPVVAKYRVPTPFFILCNQFWAHKDHSTAFQAVAKLMRQGLRLYLVCTGPTRDDRDPAYFPQIQEKIKELGIESQVQILGTIPRVDQVCLIRASTGILQPSRFEGWSTVLEDARALGKPVIASDLPVHLEQAVPGSHFFRTGDSDSCATTLAKFAQFEPGPTGSPWQHDARVIDFARASVGIVEAAISRSRGEMMPQIQH